VKRIEFKLSSLAGSKPHEYAIRFFFGGLCTVLAGLIATHFGPGIGGLFLAFPAIFPASASLVASHEKERKAKVGSDGTNRGRLAASLDSAGASLGAVGLVGFALVLWKLLRIFNSLLAIVAAAIVWLLVSYSLWVLRESRMCGRRGSRDRANRR
jgi:Protein of unknown function (DUF3147)